MLIEQAKYEDKFFQKTGVNAASVAFTIEKLKLKNDKKFVQIVQASM